MNDYKTPKRSIYRAQLGRKGDPRMNRAVRIRLANPKIALVDALLAGGFTFPTAIKRQNRKEGKIYDSDGVSLNQRRNQLSKRLWHAMRKNAEATNTTHHHRGQTLLERSSVLGSAEVKCADTVSNCNIETNVFPLQKISLSNKQMYQPTYASASQPMEPTNAEFNELNKKPYNEDTKKGFAELLEVLLKVPSNVLEDELTLEEILTNCGINYRYS